ncbi:MAG TPA: FAD-binding oxidoreductase [Candidatus Limnocylindria bacterium]|nr:FAD-binding oxidoreductase [Candidatus Limnocylindria bacterium]
MADALTPADLELRPGRGDRSPWLREALAMEGDPSPLSSPGGSVRTEVAIVGGGYVGLWTALQLRERNPDLAITVLEQDICGGGPSGRNGGFVNAWWDELDTLVALYGEQRALEAAREASQSVRAIGAWCEANDVDAHYQRRGMLAVSTTPLHDDRPLGSVRVAQELGVGEELVALTAAEVAERCRSPEFRGGALMRDGATVQPALLARGLRRVALERNVRIHEGTRVRARLQRDGAGIRLAADSATGTHEIRAGRVVVAANVWAIGWRQLSRAALAWGSYMVRSEPLTDRQLDDIGWTGGESIYTARFNVEYFHVTRDRRIAIGSGGGVPGYDGRIGSTFTDDVGSARRAARAFRSLFPSLREVRLTDAWGGPIDVAGDHLPRFGTLSRLPVYYAVGFSGNGVAPSHLAGRVLAALVLESDEPITRLGPVGPPPARLPPEPFRYIGARVMRGAIVRREEYELSGRRAPWWLRQLTALPRRLGYHLGPGP